MKRQLALRQQNSTTTSKPPSSDGLAGRQEYDVPPGSDAVTEVATCLDYCKAALANS